VGYYATVSYWGDTLEVENHTLFAKKTLDYGSTWSDWYYIPDEALTNYFAAVWPDSVEVLPDSMEHIGANKTAFLGYDLDVLTDESGGLHVFSAVLAEVDEGIWSGGFPELGIYHFHMDADAFALPYGPLQPEISFVASMEVGWWILDPEDDTDTPGWQQTSLSAGYDIMNEERLYMVYHTADTARIDTSLYGFFDIMGSQSFDNGATWSDPVNITNTGLEGNDEVYPFMNRFAVDGKISLVYEVPDYDRPIFDDPIIKADHTCWVYFHEYEFGTTGIAEGLNVEPSKFRLENNYPNPFNPSTVISFSIPTQGMTELTVFDIKGRVVKSLHHGTLNAGQHEFEFNAVDLASGPYFYKLETQNFQQVKKMLLIK